MTLGKYAAGLGAIACLLTSTAAFAADATRSGAALPAAKAATAPVQGIRSATTLKKKSKAIGRDPSIALGILGGAAVGAAIIVATDDDDDSDSPG